MVVSNIAINFLKTFTLYIPNNDIVKDKDNTIISSKILTLNIENNKWWYVLDVGEL